MKARTGSIRTRARVAAVSFAAAALVVGTVGPVQAAEGDADEIKGTGTSSLGFVPGTLGITGLPADLDAKLGTLIASATNDGSPLARLGLGDIVAAGQKAPEFIVSSADGKKSGSEERTVGAGGLGATVGLVDYLVESGADSAIANLAALGAEITTPLGLGTELGAQNLAAAAGETGTAGSMLVNITGLELGLDDLLPADVLDALPLDVVLDLIEALGLDAILPADLVGQIGDVEGLLTTLTDTVGATTALDGLLDGGLGGIVPNSPELTAITGGIGELDGLLAEVDTLLDGLDLQALLDQLLGALTDTPILDLGSIQLSLDSFADGKESGGAVTCTASGLEILGVAVPTPGCDEVTAALDGLSDTIGQVLSALPLAGALPEITTGGLEMTSSGVGKPDDKGVSKAFAEVSALTIDIAPTDLTAITDDLVGQLGSLTGQLDAGLGGLLPTLNSLLPTLDTLVPGGLGATVGGIVDGVLGGILPGLGLAQAPGAPAQAMAVELPAGLDGALGGLTDVLNVLPTGAALDGLSTLGITAALGGVGTQSTFTAAAVPTTPGSPGSPTAPGARAPVGTLPNTGLDHNTLFLAALAALAAGGVTVGLGRSAALGMVRVPTRNRRID